MIYNDYVTVYGLEWLVNYREVGKKFYATETSPGEDVHLEFISAMCVSEPDDIIAADIGMSIQECINDEDFQDEVLFTLWKRNQT